MTKVERKRKNARADRDCPIRPVTAFFSVMLVILHNIYMIFMSPTFGRNKAEEAIKTLYRTHHIICTALGLCITLTLLILLQTTLKRYQP
jgi:hypothetical protein